MFNYKDMNSNELMESLREALQDLAVAANTQRESEHHQECFATVMLFAQEVSNRGLKISPLH